MTKTEFDALAKDVRSMEEQAGELLLKIDSGKEKLYEHLKKEGLKELQVEGDQTMSGKVLSVKRSERATVKYDVNRLKQKLSDEVFTEVTHRTYTVTDMNEMISLVRNAGVSASEFRKLISVDVKPVPQQIKLLYDSGEITMKQLQGCYTANVSHSIKFTEGPGGNN